MQVRSSSRPVAMRFTINLASPRQPAERTLQIGVGLALLVLVMILVAQGMIWRSAKARLGELDAGSRRVQTLQARVITPSPTPPASSIETSVATINSLLARKAFSWTGLLTDLEEAVPPRIAIQRVSPRWGAQGADNSVDLGGEAASLKDLAALIIALEHAPRFEDAFLSRQRMREDGVVEFSLHVRYTGAL